QGVSAIAEALQATDFPRPQVIASMSWDGAEGASDPRVQAIEHWPGVVVKVPTLRDRAGDIPLLLESLTRTVTATSHGPRWAPEALQVVSRIQWPSNVASLARLVVTMARRVPGPVIHAADLPTDVIAMASRRQLFGLEHVEAHAIAAALKAVDGNKKLAADRLGIARSTLYRKMRALGIDLTASAY
ncbi:MAG TPA: helix-turn-helix domain-containing protein, partial [Mycobacterium sp.]